MTFTSARASLALAALLAGCDAEARIQGSWELATIDGVGPAVAAPLRVIFPAGVFGPDSVAAGALWHEVTFDGLVLTLEPGGTFRERAVESKRTLVRPSAYERPEYVSGAFGGDLLRDDAEPATAEASGAWALASDSLVLTAPREQAVEALLARMRQALPAAPEDALRAAAESAVPAGVRPRWTGVARGERLELRDPEGRVFAFRRGPRAG